jgi:hypothetical protein
VLDNTDLNALLAEARSLEAQGRASDALVSLIVVVGDLLGRHKTHQYVFEWMAQLQSGLGEHQAAERSAIAARQIAEEAHHGPGMFRMDVLRAKIACDAQDLARAEALLAGLRGDGPPLGTPSTDRRDAIVGWLRDLRFSDRPRENIAPIQVEFAACMADLWSERGKYESALTVLDVVVPSLPGAGPTVNANQFRLRQVELLLAAGRLHDATVRLDALAPGTGVDRVRVALVRARVALAGGQLARALEQLDVLAAAPTGDPQLFSAAALARLAVLIELNLHETAQRTIGDAIASLTATGAPPRTIALLEQARRDANERQRSTLTLWEQPFAAGRANDAAAAPAVEAEPDLAGWSFSAAWTAAANRVFAALERQDVPAAVAAHAELARLVRGSESELIACRVELSAALVAYYRGTRATDRFLAISDRLRAIGARIAEAQAVRFASWAAARNRALDDYARLARRASNLIDVIAGELDAKDRALFLLNKWTGRDELASVLVRNLLRDRRDRPRAPSRRRLCRGFREIEQLTHWPIEDALGEPQAAALAGDASPDLALTWVRARLAAGPARGQARGAITLRWWPSLWWFPARTLVLHYHVMPDRTYLFRIARRHIDVVILPVGRIHFTRSMAEVAGSDGDLRDLASDLGIPEALARFPAARRLVIVPHDALANTPFAALPIGDRRLCELLPISQVDRLSRLVRGRPRSPGKPERLLCAGRASYAGSGLPDLPGAEREVAAVLDAIGCTEPPHRDATCRDLLAELPRATHLHLAAHGVFDFHDPARSGVKLGDGLGGYETLTLHDLRRTDLRGLALATLATCRSAEHVTLPGRERICLPTALLDAGARGVIASLWPVDDAASVEVMTALYRQLASKPPSMALADTQTAMRGARPVHHWAGLVFYGND